MIVAFYFASLFTTGLLEIGGHSVFVEIAKTQEARALGLKGRTFLPSGEGMLFVYDSPQILSFWMKDTLIPLSIGFFDAHKRLINVEDMNPVEKAPFPIFQSSALALFALEISQGWFEEQNIDIDTPFTLKE